MVLEFGERSDGSPDCDLAFPLLTTPGFGRRRRRFSCVTRGDRFLFGSVRRGSPPGRYAACSSERARSTWPASIHATAVASMTIRARPTRHFIFFSPRMKWCSKP